MKYGYRRKLAKDVTSVIEELFTYYVYRNTDVMTFKEWRKLIREFPEQPIDTLWKWVFSLYHPNDSRQRAFL